MLQTASALERAAYELTEDCAAENCVYLEVRFAPHFHTVGGLGLDAVMGAVIAGLKRGEEDFGVESGLIVCAMRNQSAELSLKLAELAVSWFGRGCCGFDLAGEEAGHPPKHHIEAFQLIKRRNGSLTIHAGESFGPESIWHGAPVLRRAPDRARHPPDRRHRHLRRQGDQGRRPRHLRARPPHPHRYCLQSNRTPGPSGPSMSTPSLPPARGLPGDPEHRQPLMSHTTMTDEFRVAVEQFGCTLDDLERVTVNAMNAAFFPYAERHRIIDERIAYAA